MNVRDSDKTSAEQAIQAAFKLLSQRPYSEKALRDRLRDKGFTFDAIRETIDFCRQKNFVNDREYAKLFIEQRLEIRPRAGHVLIGELLKRGIPLKLAKETVEENVSHEIESESASTLAAKKWKQYAHLGEDVCFRRVSAYLARRGYNWDTISSAIKETRTMLRNQKDEQE